MTKNKGYSLVFTNSDIERIAKNSTAEVAAKQLVTVRDERRSSSFSPQKSSLSRDFKEVSGRNMEGRPSAQSKPFSGSVMSRDSSEYSSKQAVDMFNQAFKKARA